MNIPEVALKVKKEMIGKMTKNTLEELLGRKITNSDLDELRVELNKKIQING